MKKKMKVPVKENFEGDKEEVSLLANTHQCSELHW